jgi:hypothetical protein
MASNGTKRSSVGGVAGHPANRLASRRQTAASDAQRCASVADARACGRDGRVSALCAARSRADMRAGPAQTPVVQRDSGSSRREGSTRRMKSCAFRSVATPGVRDGCVSQCDERASTTDSRMSQLDTPASLADTPACPRDTGTYPPGTRASLLDSCPSPTDSRASIGDTRACPRDTRASLLDSCPSLTDSRASTGDTRA